MYSQPGPHSSPLRSKKTRTRAAARYLNLAFEQLEDRLALAAPCNSGAVLWPAPAPGATGVAFTLTSERDVFVATTTVVAGTTYLAVHDGDGDGIPCWDSSVVPFTAAATTWISVTAPEENDQVDLSLMTPAAFPLLGTTSRPTVAGGSGWDVIRGSFVNDLLTGGPDQDEIYGMAGNDEIHGMAGHDKIYGESGNDLITGGDDTDIISGGADNDTISGNDQFDFLYGNGGIDTINGNDGDDYISGGDANDTLNGDLGQDIIEGGQGDDTIDGGDQTDFLYSYVPGTTVDQPWRTNGQGTAGWFDMDKSGDAPNDLDGDCDLEDSHADLDGVACTPNAIIANNDEYSVSHRSTLTAMQTNVLANDNKTPTPPAPLPTAVLHSGPMYATSFTLNADGTFSYDPVDSFVGTDSFYYHINQGGVTSAWPAVVAIHVTNSPPVAVGDFMGTPKNTPVTQNVIANDTDNDPGDLPSVVVHSIVTPPPAAEGTVSFVPGTKNITFTPAPGFVGYTSFTYKATDGIDVSQNAATVNVSVFNMLTLYRRPADLPSSDTPTITDADLALLANEAARRWVAAGVDPITAQKALDGTDFVIADLAGSMLGMELPGRIVIDVNAAGYGWFVDATPGIDEEFSIFVAPSERQAGRGSAALGKADALTVIMHEFGHALGMVHVDGDCSVSPAMRQVGS